jgi:hypothetical protein
VENKTFVVGWCWLLWRKVWKSMPVYILQTIGLGEPFIQGVRKKNAPEVG